MEPSLTLRIAANEMASRSSLMSADRVLILDLDLQMATQKPRSDLILGFAVEFEG